MQLRSIHFPFVMLLPFCLLLSCLFLSCLFLGCNPSKENSANQNQSGSTQKPETEKPVNVIRANPPKAWANTLLKSSKINVYFPSAPRTRERAPEFMEARTENKITIYESRADGLRCQAAEYRVKPSLTAPDKGLKEFTLEAIKAAIRFQHNASNYDLEEDPDKLLKQLNKVKISEKPAYLFKLQVRDGTIEGCTIYSGGYIVFAWAGTNAETTPDAEQRRSLFVNCITAE